MRAEILRGTTVACSSQTIVWTTLCMCLLRSLFYHFFKRRSLLIMEYFICSIDVILLLSPLFPSIYGDEQYSALPISAYAWLVEALQNNKLKNLMVLVNMDISIINLALKHDLWAIGTLECRSNQERSKKLSTSIVGTPKHVNFPGQHSVQKGCTGPHHSTNRWLPRIQYWY